MSAALSFKTSTDLPFHRGVYCSQNKEMEIKRMFATKVLIKENLRIFVLHYLHTAFQHVGPIAIKGKCLGF